MDGSADRELRLLDDASWAARDGLMPAHLAPTGEGDSSELKAASELACAYVVEHGLEGYGFRARGERGVVARCPDWCDSSHDPVAFLLDDDDPREHEGCTIRFPNILGGSIDAFLYASIGARGTVDAAVMLRADQLVAVDPGQARLLAAALLALADAADAA